MLKHHADAFVVALAETSRDEDLYAYGKAHRQGGEDEVIQARHHGATQLVGAKVTQECSVGEGDDGLRQVTKHDGVRDAPDLFVRNGGFNHGQVTNRWQKYTIPRKLLPIFYPPLERFVFLSIFAPAKAMKNYSK